MSNKKEQKSIKNKQATLEPKNMNPASDTNVFSDILGSYTGVPADGGEPVQDADDL